MGCCCSIAANSASTASSIPTAIVIALDGSLREYAIPIIVSKVLGIDHLTWFICNSNSLSFDSLIPRLHPDELLRQDQIYFVLPKSKLEFPLTGAEMAAMAVKASLALSMMASEEKGKRQQRRNISIALVDDDNYGNATIVNGKELGRNGTAGLTWGKVWCRSIRRSLSMIIKEVDE